ncbi:MAG: hypothetical protein NZT92_00350 [Abditibacteriales bacterium]|nr:hypothetical protein [Abditibacteriales bacterium]MDW8364270.1 hypothetical protein [Abditibacteriales bacterium]
MAVYWHPLLAQFLQQAYGDRLIIEEEVNLGETPLRIDLVIKRARRVALPYPFNHLGERTLLSYCGPNNPATWEDLVKLEAYALLYQIREKIRARCDVTLWLVASRFTRNVSEQRGAHLAQARRRGDGVLGGNLDGFPTCLINLNDLPVNEATLPLVLAARGKVERTTAEYLIDHPALHPRYLLPFARLHSAVLLEVLTMKEMTPEQLGWTEDLIQRWIQWLGEERILRTLGEERVLHTLGEERVRRWLEKASKKKPARDGKTPRKPRARTEARR